MENFISKLCIESFQETAIKQMVLLSVIFDGASIDSTEMANISFS